MLVYVCEHLKKVCLRNSYSDLKTTTVYLLITKTCLIKALFNLCQLTSPSLTSKPLEERACALHSLRETSKCQAGC